MSGDRRLRALERERAGADPEAEAALWSERLRRGEACPRRLGLAAYLGHRPAQDALGASRARPPGSQEAWMAGLVPELGRLGAEAWVRAAHAGAARAVALFEAHHQDPRPREALEAIARWLAERGAEQAQAAHAAADACYVILGELEHERASPQAAGRSWAEVWATAFRETRAAGLAALSAAHAGDMGLRYAKLSLAAARERLALAEVPPGPGGRALFERAAQVDRLGHLPELHTEASAAALRAAIASALVPWALGRAGGPG
ncbi:MAG: hypothetical protein AB7N76_27695 [Planctomycetota bacterium]